MRRLGELLDGIAADRELEPVRDRLVSGIHDDSRTVTKNGLFVAVRGTGTDGRHYVSDALQRGASALVGESLAPADGAAVVNVRDARRALALLAMRWYGFDRASTNGFSLLAVTGTNGKSTTTFMTRAILRAAGIQAGMFGTVQYDLCSRAVASSMTTPGPLQLADLLVQCRTAGARAAVMEVSSHALDQKRTDGLHFAAAAFTNLTQDHLDYHGTFERYRDAKARLFSQLDAQAVAVLNADDPANAQMAADCRARLVRYSLRNRDADIHARIARESIRGTTYSLHIDGRELVLENAIAGRHNVYNAMAAAGLARAIGVPFEAIEKGLSSVRNIPGRLQRVPRTHGAEVFVDYAHTDDALTNVLGVLKPLTRNRLIVVFGCGGDRDRTKRPKMARAVAEFADAIIVTSDNPRSEEPRAIISDILAGFDAATRRRVLVEPDRRDAIRAAIAAAGEDDVVLIAGKGHEDYQIIGQQKVHFDDVEVAIQAAAELAGTAAGDR